MGYRTRLGLAVLVACGATLWAVAGVAAARQNVPGADGRATATFAGGCFWCMEPPFEELDGVFSVVSGYTGGRLANPTYEQVSGGGTGHTEAVEITYDPSKVSYEKLLEVYWRNVDAVDGDGQFCDRGSQYRPAIFAHSDEQQRLAEASKQQAAGRLNQPIQVQIVKAGPFYRAEAYHQDYYKTNPLRYKFYKWNCGREQRLDALWGKKAGD
jgi:peptide-methionine (S)-S-oxide reductase